MVTKLLDIFVSLIGLLLLLLMLPWIALLIKIDSRGPVFYRCDRVGLGGKLFKMYKFRTMYETPHHLGPSLSPPGDPRVTPVGRILRRLKLNEFPQFINVLKGDMTLIGPRPEAPDLAAAYPEEAKKIFTGKPGLAGPNQILGRNEEELYPPGVDPVKYYIEHLLPRKLPLDLQYIEDQSVFKNLKYLFLSVKVTLTGAITRQHLIDNRSQIYLLLCDSCLCLVSFCLAHYLRYEGFFSEPAEFQALLRLLPWIILVRLPFFLYFGFYNPLIGHLSFYDLKNIFKGVTLSSFVLLGVFFLLGFTIYAQYGKSGLYYPRYARGIFVIDWFCLIIFLAGYRIILKKFYLRYKDKNGSPKSHRRVLIWGAGDAGELCLRYLEKQREMNYEVVGFIDDEPQKWNRRLNGIKVMGSRYNLEILTHLYKIQEVFVAMPSASESELERALEFCHQKGLTAKLFHLGATDYSEISPPQPQLAELRVGKLAR
jgi:lipopolysaccharide/colanic/teichoic acid biosynthesis glycosyltransferase